MSEVPALNDLAGLLAAAAANNHYAISSSPSLDEVRSANELEAQVPEHQESKKAAQRGPQGRESASGDPEAPQEDHSQGSGFTQKPSPAELLAEHIRTQALGIALRR